MPDEPPDTVVGPEYEYIDVIDRHPRAGFQWRYGWLERGRYRVYLADGKPRMDKPARLTGWTSFEEAAKSDRMPHVQAGGPTWVLPVMGGIPVGLLVLARGGRSIRSRRRRRQGRCVGCGYDRRHSPGVCPECGRAAPGA